MKGKRCGEFSLLQPPELKPPNSSYHGEVAERFKASRLKRGSPARRRGFGDPGKGGGGGVSEASEHIPPFGEDLNGTSQFGLSMIR